MTSIDLRRRVVGEGVATAFLLAAIVGSGIMGERLADGNVALALLANSLATGAALLALITVFQPISGAHLNPVVTLVDAWTGGPSWTHVPAVLAAQFAGAAVGVWAAHAMFGEAWISVSTHDRGGYQAILSECIATFGLVMVVMGAARRGSDAVPGAVSAYIVAAYWFTASTSFANPAVTLARSMTGTFAGIRAADVGGFVFGQLAGAAAAACLCRWMLERPAGGLRRP